MSNLASLMPMPKYIALANINGVFSPIANGYVYAYVAGTSTPKDTFTTALGDVVNANPVRLDSRGEASIFLAAGNYDIELHDASDALIWKQYNVLGSASARSFNTNADLLLASGIFDGEAVSVLGYYSIGDGGDDYMYWSSSSTATHNGGTIRKPTDVSGAGRWLSVNTQTINVKKFGADSTGINDCSSVFQTCLTLASTSGSPMYIPAGTYTVSATSSAYNTGTTTGINKIIIYGDGAGTVIQTSVNCVFSIGASGKYMLHGTQIKDFLIRPTTDLYFASGLIKLIQNQEYTIENVILDCGEFGDSEPYCAVLLKLDGSYQGYARKCLAIGEGAVLYEIGRGAVTTAQEDTTIFEGCSSFYGFVGGFLMAAGGGRHNYHVRQFKHRVSESSPFSSTYLQTTLLATAAAGATSFRLTDAAVATACDGSYLLIGNGGNTEIVKVSSIDGDSVFLAHPLRFTHTVTGTRTDPFAIFGAVGCVLGGNTYNIHFSHPHFEAGAIGVLTDNTTNLFVDDYFCSSRDVVSVQAGTGNSSVNGIIIGKGLLDTNLATAWGTTPPQMACIRITANADSATNKPNRLEVDRFSNYGSGSTATRASITNDAGTVRTSLIHDTSENSTFPVRKLTKMTTTADAICDAVYRGTQEVYSLNTDGTLKMTNSSGTVVAQSVPGVSQFLVNKLAVANRAAANVAVGALNGKIEVFDASGSSLGYIPTYVTIT